ncbi:MAG: 50S ribosomal protein L10 [Phycisphaerales bacterium]|nr:50S ribosomal protein L10 [Phycisphaerales bacterium]
MSKPIKEMMIREYQDILGDHEDALVIGMRGIASNDTNAIRSGLAEKEIKVTVVRNKLFGQAFGDSKLAPLSDVLVGANALAFGAESVVEVAREIVEIVKDFPGVELKGAVLDGMLFEGDEGVRKLSKFPTRDEAIAKDVALILGPGSKLVASVKGPGSNLAGILKAIESKLEDGEAIAKV